MGVTRDGEGGREATKVLFCLTRTRELLHKGWREEGRKEGVFREVGAGGREGEGGGGGGGEEGPIGDYLASCSLRDQT